MRKIVVSGINIVSGGMMSVFKDCLRELLAYDKDVEVIVLVHKKELFYDLQDCRLMYMEFPMAKRSWLLRCYYEYVYFYRLSKRIKPDLWLSMHDMSPRVFAKSQAVYCHNAAPFFKLRREEYFKDIKLTLFVLFYKYLYGINIHSNRYVIVQQDWMRKEFERLYDIHNVIVAHPTVNLVELNCTKSFEKGVFIYPATPQMYKNIELVCEAVKNINDNRLKIYITIDGSENRYARQVVRQYKNVSAVSFIGRQTRENVFEYYNRVEGLVFPSRLESWGMPLSEFAQTGKVILAADLPYAHEVLCDYEHVCYLPVNNSKAWENALKNLLADEKIENHVEEKNIVPYRFYADSWQRLFFFLYSDDILQGNVKSKDEKGY